MSGLASEDEIAKKAGLKMKKFRKNQKLQIKNQEVNPNIRSRASVGALRT